MRIAHLLLSAMTITFPARLALAEHTTIILPENGRSVSLDFQPVPHSPGNFRSIRIRSAEKIVTFTPKNPTAYIPIDQEEKISRGLWENPTGLELDHSRFFFRGEFTSGSSRRTLLFFISEGYASDAAPIFVVGFTNAGDPYKVLELAEYDPTAIRQASDGTAQIIGKSTLSEIVGGDGGNGSKAPYATTYDPFSVFIVRAEETAHYSFAASKHYNEQHYVWAGQHSREDYAVFYNIPEHRAPFGAPAAQISKLLGSSAVPNLK
jgi:hypothetical protein